MAPKAILVLLATLLLLTSEDPLIAHGLEGSAPEHIPAKAPAPAPAKSRLSPAPQSSAKPPTAPVMPPVKSKADCIPLCEGRCQLHSRKRVCMRACMTCCNRCKCVPPGTYGNREMCGKCYTDMTTRGNRSKCP